jgi:peptidoglycan/LPS O-acetylase OafA/YrhL
MSSPRPHRADLDGLRAVAVLAVLVHHVAPTALPAGFAGVDVFFVLSGFLISGIVADEVAAGTFAWRAFVLRRARRLLPALVVVLAATGLLGAALLTGPELVSLARHAMAATVSGANILLWREVGYFDAAAESKPLLHLWSLGVEEQFYLVWPPLLVALSRARRPRWRLAVVAALATASFALAQRIAPTAPGEAFYLLHTRAWELLAGALLALAVRAGATRGDAHAGDAHAGDVHAADAHARGTPRAHARTRHVATIGSLAGAALLVATFAFVRPSHAWPGTWTLLPVLGTLLLIAAGPHAPVNRTVLSWRAATWLGLRSYPLYLWHWPLLSLLHVVAPDAGLDAPGERRAAIALAVVAVLLADLTFRHVERPVQRRVLARTAGREARLADLRPFARALALVLLVAGVTVHAHGFPARYDVAGRDAPAILAAAARDRIEAVETASTRCTPAAATLQGSWCFRHGDSARVAILGDSHAEALFATLATTLPRDAGVMLVGRPGCAPTLLDDVREPDSPAARFRARCRRAVRLAHGFIAREGGVHTVLLAARGAYQFTATPAGRETGLPILPVAVDAARPDTARLAALWEAGMARTIDTLLAAGRRVILVVDYPELGFDPRSCLEGRPLGLRAVRSPCTVPRATLDARTASYRAAIARLAARFPALEQYDATAPLCDARACRVLAGDTLLYHDDDHLSLAGGRVAFGALMPMLARRVLVAARP